MSNIKPAIDPSYDPGPLPAWMGGSGEEQKTNGANGLGIIRQGRVHAPLRLLLYGQAGVGKSTFAAGMPSPIFLGSEDGSGHLDVARFPQPRNLREILSNLSLLLKEKHDYKTVIVDSLDWVEPLIWEEVARSRGKQHVEDIGFGKGYVQALTWWKVLLDNFDELRDKHKARICLLAHSQIKQFHDPEAEDGDGFDRYQLKLHQKAAELVSEWSDVKLFARFEYARQGKRTETRRVLCTRQTKAFDAKTRYRIPDTLELSWNALEQAIKESIK